MITLIIYPQRGRRVKRKMSMLIIVQALAAIWRLNICKELPIKSAVNSTLAFEIGAVFLFAAMLMFGSAHGFIPRSMRSVGAPILVGVVLVGFLMWRFGPDLYANMRSTAAPWFASESATSEASPAKTSETGNASARAPVKSAAPKAHAAKQAYPAANKVVIRDVVTAPEVHPAVEPAQLAAAPAPVADASDTSPYDSGVKRAVKSVGHFLHIGAKRKEPAAQ
jgi:hypothetical protein